MNHGILIVENELIVATDLHARLSFLGYPVAGTAVSGEQALRAIADLPPDLVLMDIRLSGAMDGIEAAETIRTKYGIPVLYLSAYADEKTVERAKRTEPFGYLVKPFDDSELRAAIEMALYRKKAEDALRESEARFRTLAETAAATIFILIDGTFSYVNGFAERLFGVPKAALLNQEFARYVHKDFRETLVANLRNHAAIGQQEMRSECKLVRADGSERWLDIAAAPIQTDGQTGVLVIAMDVTDRKTQEEEYRSLQAQLLQAQKMESIGTLAVGLVHNMNNILAIVMGYASRLEHFGDDPARVQQSVYAINQATQRGAALLQQLTGVAAKANLQFAPVSVNSVVQEILPMVAEIFPRTIVFRQNLQADLPPISADANQIHQALLNILVNARDAMPDGGTISLMTEALAGPTLRGRFPNPQDAPYVRVRVVDTGEGMTPETRSRIFEPFFTTRDKETYPGLGLSTVYGIVTSHKGFVDVTSAPGEGTTVDLYFPAQAHSVPIQPAPMPDRRSDFRGGDETILVVEDEDMLRGLVREVLTRGGYTVLEAADGEEGIAQYVKSRSSIDLVLLDLGLPKRSGDSVFTELKKLNPGVRVVFSTGYVKKEKSSELRELGALGVVHKPYAVDELMSVVRTSLDKR